MTKMVSAFVFAFLAPIAVGVALPAHADNRLPDPEIVIDPQITIKGNSTSSAAKGTYKDAEGKEQESTADEVKDSQEYNMKYDGDTEFKADYTIVCKADGSIDLDKSTIKFITINYTHQNYRRVAGKLEKLGMPKKEPSTFTTLPIKITGVTLNDDGSIKSLTFSSNDWYPPDAPLGKVLINKGLSGEIDMNAGKATFKAKYQNPYNGVISTYDVTGTFPKPPAAPACPKPAAAGAAPGAAPGGVPPNPFIPPPLVPALGFGAILGIGLFSEPSPASP
jgi:hypothetical protein